MFYKGERMAVLIDGANLYATSKALGFDLDYKMLRGWLTERGIMSTLNYYTTILETEEYSAIKPLTDWLAYNGYNVIAKQAREFVDSQGRRRVKGNVEVELTVDALTLASTVGHIVLFTGDGDYVALVNALKNRGVRVSLVSTIKSSPPLAADNLRRAIDNFIDLDDLRPYVSRVDRNEKVD